MVDLEQILAGRKSDLARQQEKTPDFPASWQALQRTVVSAEREFNKSGKEYQQHNERIRSALGQLSDPMGDFVLNIVRSVVPELRAGAPSPNTPPTGPKAMRKADIEPLEARLAELEKQQQAAAAKTESELQALQSSLKAITTEREELQKKEQAMLWREKAAEGLIKDHQNLVSEHQRLNERCAALEMENKKLSSEHGRFEKLLESNRKSCQELDKKVEKPRVENKKLREDVEKARSELETIKKEQSQSEVRQQKVSSELRGKLKTASENHDKVVTRVSKVEKQATTIEGSLRKTTDELKGFKTSVASGPRNTTTPEMSAEIAESMRQVTAHSEAIAGLTSNLQAMSDSVESHQALLNNFDPDELDQVWWTLPKLKEDNKALGEQMSALENLHNELRAEVQDAKQSASREEAKDAAAPAPPTTSATDNPQRIDYAVRTAEEAARRVEKVDKFGRCLKMAQDTMIQAMGRMIDGARSEAKDLGKRADAGLVSVKERLDALEKSKDETKHTPADANTPGAQPDGEAKDAPSADKDLVTRNELQKLDKFVRENFADYSDRLGGLQQLYLDWKRQLANAPSAPPQAGGAPPQPRPPGSTGMVRPTGDAQGSARPNGLVKRRRMDSPLHSGTPPATNGAGRH